MRAVGAALDNADPAPPTVSVSSPAQLRQRGRLRRSWCGRAGGQLALLGLPSRLVSLLWGLSRVAMQSSCSWVPKCAAQHSVLQLALQLCLPYLPPPACPARYCGTACSHADWRAGHRRTCKALAAARQLTKAAAAGQQRT